jgi:site-specific DNA-methyltransferase (adenine-specific)
MNTLYYGDNLKILREYIKDESVDLIYLDPPFNSNRNYNVLFKDESGVEAEAQITAFEDTWHWNLAAEETYHELVIEADDVSKMVEAFRSFIGTNQMMAYLVMMAVRLKELHRVLKPTGSLYLHCDPTASHYLRILLDSIFGVENFRNEIVWKRTSAHANVSQKFGVIHDVIYFYSKTNQFDWNQQHLAYDDEYIATFFDQTDSDGRKYARRDLTASMQRASSGQLYTWNGITPPPSRCWAMAQDKMDGLLSQGRIHFPKKIGGMPRLKLFPEDLPGVPIQDIWDDIKPLHNLTSERLGYPTQKPVALLERIVQASSNEGDTVLDPFCGCGTTIAAAQKLNRNWIGIDVTHLSIALQKYRLKDSFGLVPIGKKSVPSVVADGLTAGIPGKVGAEADLQPSATADGTDLVANYQIIGEPEDLQSAEQLATEDRYQFQWWALSLIKARPLGATAGSKAGKKGSDKGIDGVINFIDDNSGKAKRVLVQVKSGGVKSGDIRDLVGTIDRESAAIGVFITLAKPSRDMTTEAASAGFYTSEYFGNDYPRIQILTIEELLAGKEVQMPMNLTTFKQAEKIFKDSGQKNLF